MRKWFSFGERPPKKKKKKKKKLSKGTFLSDKLGDAAINQAFTSASNYNDDRASYAKSYFDHPAVSAKDYYDALYYSYDKKSQTNELFHWLLARAGRQDVDTAKSDEGFSKQEIGFQEAVNAGRKPSVMRLEKK